MVEPLDEPDTITKQGAWKILLDAGVPLGPARRRPAMPPVPVVAAALLAVGRARERLSRIEIESLRAFLRAWRQHWPSSFDQHLGPEGHALVAALDAERFDPDRYLKLKRIAVEHLARGL